MELTAKVTARKLGVSRSRLSQIVSAMKGRLGRIRTVGNVQVFTPEQIKILRERDKKPGPKANKDTNGKVK